MTLFNNKKVHESCIDKLNIKKNKYKTEKSQTYDEYAKYENAENEVRRRLDSFLGKFLYSDTEDDFETYQKKRIKFAKKYYEIEKKIKKINNKLVKIYDYWPTYPPDMKQRRKEVLNKYGFKCAETGCTETSGLHIHHVKYIKNGGMHKIDNLIPLCENHHQRKHNHKFSEIYENDKKSFYSRRLNEINKAIESGKEIKFRHYKFKEKKWLNRHVRPNKVTKEVYINGELFDNSSENLYVQGYCYLRDDQRTFRIDRIRGLKILNV